MATIRTLLMAMLFLSAVTAYTVSAAAAGDGEVSAPDYAGPMTGVKAGEYALCRDGCSSDRTCKNWCKNKGYSRGGECAGPFLPMNQQCCCIGPYSA